MSKFSGDTDLLVADLQRAVGPWYEIIPKGEKKLLIKGKHTKALKAYFAEEDQLVGGRIV